MQNQCLGAAGGFDDVLCRFGIVFMNKLVFVWVEWPLYAKLGCQIGYVAFAFEGPVPSESAIVAQLLLSVSKIRQSTQRTFISGSDASARTKCVMDESSSKLYTGLLPGMAFLVRPGIPGSAMSC